ncbi:hypothetical protein [Aliidiomarina soli]|nr:hypothetical protein [Aliidiomarina soli]
MKNFYPYWKVIISFTLCPAVAGYFLGTYIMITSLVFHEGYESLDNVLDMILIIVFVPFLISLGAFAIFCVPAFIAAAIYATFRLRKSWYSFAFILIIGGLAAHFWLPVIWSLDYISWELTYIFNMYSVLGSVSSLFVAYFALPNKTAVPPARLL